MTDVQQNGKRKKNQLNLTIYLTNWCKILVICAPNYSQTLNVTESTTESHKLYKFISRLLRNGSCVKFLNAPEPLCDYNLLPPENSKFFVQAILAEDAGISYVGFSHIKGCTKLEKIVLKNCGYIEDQAMAYLKYRKDTLKHLELIDCKNITDEGLNHLKELDLKTLVIKNVPYVKNFEAIEKELRSAMKNCEMILEK